MDRETHLKIFNDNNLEQKSENNASANFKHNVHPNLDFNDATDQIQREEKPKLDYKALKAEFIQQTLPVLNKLYPEGRVVGQRFLIGDIDGKPGKSLDVSLTPEKTGLWIDRATDERGDLFDLWAYKNGLDIKTQFSEVMRTIAQWLGTDMPMKPKTNRPNESTTDKKVYIDNLGMHTNKWDYYDAKGNLIACMYRYDTAMGKVFRSLDVKARRYQSPPEPRPLYNLPGISKANTIVITEGEKCADAVIAAGLAATTAMNGAKAPLNKTDWSPLRGKDIVIWPDNDTAGKDYAEKLGQSLRHHPVRSVSILEIPSDKPDKWDAADAMEAGIDLSEFIASQPKTVPELASVDLISDLSSTDEAWPKIKTINDSLHPVPKFKPELLPDSLHPWMYDVAKRMDNAPMDYIAVGALCALGSLIGRKRMMLPKCRDNWTVVPNLWGMIVGWPSMKKTPSLSQAITCLETFEKQEKDNYAEAMLDYHAESRVLDIDRKKIEKQFEQLVNQGQRYEAKMLLVDFESKAKQKPTRRRYLVNDATIEKLGELLAENPNGILQFRDELTGWLKRLEKPECGTDKSFYLEAWNGLKGFKYDRIGRGTIEIDNAIVSVLGGVQPGKLAPYLKEQSAENNGRDGFIERFQLMVFPDQPKFEYTDEYPNALASFLAEEAFQAVYKMEADKDPEKNKLRFDQDAQEIFNTWYKKLMTRLSQHKLSEQLESHLAKYPSLMPSLALIFQLVESPAAIENVNTVGVAAAKRAIAWCDFLEQHAIRVYTSINRGHGDAHKLLEKLPRMHDGFTQRDVLRKGFSGLTKANVVEKALLVLCKHGYLVKQTSPDSKPGRPKTQYWMNPYWLNEVSGFKDDEQRAKANKLHS